MNYLTVSKLANYYGVHPQTIRRWTRTGNLVEHHRTIGNHRRFEEPKKPDGQTIGYVRVSSANQKFDLKIQEQALAEKASLQNITMDMDLVEIMTVFTNKIYGFEKQFK